MTHGDSAVSGICLAGKQIRHRTAYDIAAAQYHAMLAGRLNAVMLQQQEYAIGRGWKKGILTQSHAAHINRMEAVHVLHG